MPHMVWARTRLYLSVPAKRVGREVYRGFTSPQICPQGRWKWYLSCLDNVHVFICVLYTWAHKHSASVCCFLLLCDVMLLPCPCAANALTGAGALSISWCASWEAWDTLARWVCLKDENLFSYPGTTWCFLHMQLQCCWLNSFRP